jgi:glutamate-1-semialdehyde 2,1-aminomutase
MSVIAPLGPAYQAGTLSGNPLAMAAGAATIDLLDAEAYARLETIGQRLEDGLVAAARDAGVAARVQRVASLLTVFFTGKAIRNEAEAKRSDLPRFAAFHRAMLRRNVLLPPSQFECFFLSLAHTDADVAEVVEAARASFEEVAS